ncbi:MAG TPA: transposase, partial [Aequorivita sp.]|nr:transposase [Aequorivita sp.]
GLAKRKKDKLEGFRRDNLYYNEEQDFYVCPMGQRMEKVAEFTSRTKSGYKQQNSVYQAQNCEGCPLRAMCFKGKNNRRVQRNHNLERHKQRAREKLLSDIGEKYRKKRSVDVEPVFGHLKYNRNFNRFTHRGLEKVEIEFGLHALANNLKKMSA